VPALPDPQQPWRLPRKKIQLTQYQSEQCREPEMCAKSEDVERVKKDYEIWLSYQQRTAVQQYNLSYTLHVMNEHLGGREALLPLRPILPPVARAAMDCVASDRDRLVVGEHMRLLGYCVKAEELPALLTTMMTSNGRRSLQLALDCSTPFVRTPPVPAPLPHGIIPKKMPLRPSAL